MNLTPTLAALFGSIATAVAIFGGGLRSKPTSGARTAWGWRWHWLARSMRCSA